MTALEIVLKKINHGIYYHKMSESPRYTNSTFTFQCFIVWNIPDSAAHPGSVCSHRRLRNEGQRPRLYQSSHERYNGRLPG